MAELTFDNWSEANNEPNSNQFPPQSSSSSLSPPTPPPPPAPPAAPPLIRTHHLVESSMTTTSMPELISSHIAGESASEMPSSPSKPNQQTGLTTAQPIKKGVRFEGIQDTLPRSRSYSGRPMDSASKRTTTRRNRRKACSADRRGHSDSGGPSTSRTASVGGRRHHQPDDDSDASSVCSTCSSSSSSGDDHHVYQLPQRRHYGGVRVSYVPNDAIACARKRKQETEGGDKDNKNCIIS